MPRRTRPTSLSSNKKRPWPNPAKVSSFSRAARLAVALAHRSVVDAHRAIATALAAAAHAAAHLLHHLQAHLVAGRAADADAVGEHLTFAIAAFAAIKTAAAAELAVTSALQLAGAPFELTAKVLERSARYFVFTCANNLAAFCAFFEANLTTRNLAICFAHRWSAIALFRCCFGHI